MTGLFQIFDRYRALARSKSVPKKVVAASHGQALPGGERDPSCINFAYHMFQDESGQRRATPAGQGHLPQLEASREPRRSSIDNSEVMVAKTLEAPKDIQTTVESKPQPPRTSLDSRSKPRLSFYLKDEASSEDTTAPSSAKDVPNSVSVEPPGYPISGLHQRRSSDPAVATPRLSVDGKVPGNEDKEKKTRDFKDMLKGSFKRKGPRVNSQESPGSSFDLKEVEQVKTVPELQMENREGLSSLPVSGQVVPGEDEEFKEYSVFTGSPNGWLESRDGSTPRLTVELKDGPQLTRKDDQRVLSNDISRLTGSEDPCEYIIRNAHDSFPLGSKESPEVMGSKDLRKTQMNWAPNPIDSRELSRPPAYGKAAGSRLSADRPPASRQSGGDREFHRSPNANNWFAQNIHKSLETSTPVLLRKDNAWCASPGRTVDGNWENGLEGSKWKTSSVVARLMGLEDLPNFDLVSNAEASSRMSPMEHYPALQRGGSYYMQPDESPCRDDEDSYQVFGTDEVVTPLRKDTSSKCMSGVPLGLSGRQQALSVSTPPRLQFGYPISPDNKGQHTPASPKHLSVSPKHHMIESLPQVLKHQVELKSSSEGLLYSDMDQRLRQLGLKNTIQERKTLKQILEAMHHKGLLQPPRHMDSEWKHNLPRQSSNGAVAKSLFDNKKDNSSSYMVDSFKNDLFGLDYKDIPTYISAQKARSSAEGGLVPDGSKSPLRGRSGEASIVVMKPLNTKSTSKLILVKPSLDPPLEKNQEVVTVRETSAFKSLSTLATPTATIAKDGSVSMNIRISSGSETSAASAASSKVRTRSKSVDPRGQDSFEEVPISVRQRRERIAARTAKFKTEGGDQQWDNPKSTRSPSSIGKKSPKSSSPARSAFGSSVTGDAKPRARSTMEKKDIKNAIQVTRKAKSSHEQSKEGNNSEQEDRKVPTRNRLDLKSVAGDVEKTAGLESCNSSMSAAEVAILRINRTGRGSSNDLSNSALFVDVDTKGVRDASFEKNELEEFCSGEVESTTHSRSESQDVTLERSRDGSPINVMSPTFIFFESRRTDSSRYNLEDLPDDFYDSKERYESKLEDSEPQTESDAALFTDQGSSDVSMSRESQMDEPGSSVLDSSEASPPGFPVWRKGFEDRNEQLSKGVEQPSPISVLNRNFQEEECTPSPSFEKAGFVSLQGGEQEDLKAPIWQPADPSTPTHQMPVLIGDPLKDLLHKVARSLNLDDQNSFLNKPTLEIQVPHVSDLSTPSLNSVPSSFSTKEDEEAYVRHIMVASGVTEEHAAPKEWPQSGPLMKTDFFDQLEEHLELRESARKQNVYLSGEERTEYVKQALDRRVLFDCVNSILERKWYPYFYPQPWGTQSFRKKPMGAKLVEEIWEELKTIHTCALDDDTLYTILQMDFTHRAEKWVDFSVEIGEIGLEIEEMILDELVDAAVQEWYDECDFP
ncbi:uncharacterized protein [Physcomitrium patens]|uniref:DUF4378 domain-containing protein n=1 Tax=Physcomitrium patens TaxID=3218 RepID=A0A2K1IGL4_PHYPA|nr:uncharacterized protein LOC112276783 isoform X2 [Physcomitrium patens]PNR28415.1 hypothetical protein PHYPA_029007 [Physcomitrium patens]|eukprot:XP_024364244.1 uncharacterized protein LOC112276783 isoform X2 [Physcomitrella patens]